MTTVSKNRFSPPTDWSAQYLLQNPIFNELCQLLPLAEQQTWPDNSVLNGWRQTQDFQFVDSNTLAADGRYYEAFIYEKKQIPTRAANWHDLFGALIWCLFPKSKAALNQQHMAEIAEHGVKQRSILRNKLTLLDECGILVALEPAALAHAEMLQQHQWQHSFWQQRSAWWQHITPVVFGHAVYEMATLPFIGLTAKCWFLSVPSGFSGWSLTARYTFLDEKLAAQIAQPGALLDNRQLTPLPLLGVPQWYQANSEHTFYLNREYFRPLRQQPGQ